MSHFPFALVGFDLDGTLIDTSEDLRIACNVALKLGSIAPLAPEQIRSAIGGGARRMLERGIEFNGSGPVAPELFEAMFDAFLEHYQANIAVHSRPFPGALEMMDALDALGVKLAIVTNKREGMADQLFRELGLRHRFSAFLGGDSLGPDKAKPAPDLLHEMVVRAGASGPAAFVGDSHFDIDAAKAAGLPSIAVSFGFLMQPVETLGADAVIDHFDALIPALRRLSPA
ncbi:MAG: HAD-IA family hydrolase [Sphingomonadales bacterium]|jgi:phosphoglycolate phosphatase|nr:HAD-IA family hydrolase [Sphingomonadales bacterium]